MIHIQVFSDYICPYCYIGTGILETLQKEMDLEIDWIGFEIHPETPAVGTDLHEMFGKERFESMQEGLRAAAAQYGLLYNPSNRLYNSRKALLAAEFARSVGKLEDFHKAMMAESFVHQSDISQMSVLKRVAESCGMDGDAMETRVSEGLDMPKLVEYSVLAQRIGVRSTPTFVIEDKEAIVGAQPIQRFREILAKYNNQ